MEIVIVSYNRFPEGDAGAIREYSLAKLLKSLGHKVTLIGMGNSKSKSKCEYKGFEYYSLRMEGRGIFTRLKNYFLYSKRLLNTINSFDIHFDVVIVVYIPVNALFAIKKFAKLNEIDLLHDCVEWYSHNQFKLGYFAPAFILKNLYNRVLINRRFKVIAISKYLEDHFISRGITVERIPVLLPMDEIPFNKHVDNSKLRLIYAGSPGKKDYLSSMLKGLLLLDKESLKKIELQVFGVSEDDVGILLDDSDYYTIKESVKLNGRVSRKEVMEKLNKSHFSIMLRDNTQRYSKAGFPTKVVESLATGTPVITNISSDLSNYLVDGVNSIIVKDCSPEEFKLSVLRAIKLSKVKLDAMFVESRNTAVTYFDINKYRPQMERLLKKL